MEQIIEDSNTLRSGLYYSAIERIEDIWVITFWDNEDKKQFQIKLKADISPV